MQTMRGIFAFNCMRVGTFRLNFSKNSKSDLRFLILTKSSILDCTFNERLVPGRKKIRIQNQIKYCFRTEIWLNFVLNPDFFLTGTNLSLKVQAGMVDKVRIKNLKSLLAFFEKFGREVGIDSACRATGAGKKLFTKLIHFFLCRPSS